MSVARPRLALRLLCLDRRLSFFCRQLQHHHFGPHEEVEGIAFGGNTGQFDNEFDLAGSDGLEGVKVDNVKPQKLFSSTPKVTV